MANLIFDPLEILFCFYPKDDKLRKLLIRHSEQVRDKALELLPRVVKPVDREVCVCGAMLHDIGIRGCAAPGIFCEGVAHYLLHGFVGGRMLRDYGREKGLDLETYARICERHTGAGLTAEDLRSPGLYAETRERLPERGRDYLPETTEEKLICYADKFYSKGGDLREKSREKVCAQMLNFGQAVLDRFLQIEADLFSGPVA